MFSTLWCLVLPWVLVGLWLLLCRSSWNFLSQFFCLRNWNWEKIIFLAGGFLFLEGGTLTPFFFCTTLLVWVKLGYTPEFQLPRSSGSALKVRGMKEIKKERRRRRKNNTKFSGHYALAHTTFATTSDMVVVFLYRLY